MNELKVIVSTLREHDIDTLYGEYVEDFFTVYGETWRYIKDYYSKYAAFPDISVVGEKYPDVLTQEAKGHPDHYMEQLRDEYLKNSLQRVMLKGAQFASKEAGQKALAEIQAQLAKYNKYTSTSVVTDIMDFEQAEKHYDEVAERVAAGNGVPGIPTGVEFFDSGYPTGLQGGDLIVMLGWTGRAKSFFSTLITCNAYASGFTPMIASLEMDADKIRDRAWTTMGKGMFKNSSLVLGDIEKDNFNQFRSKFESEKKFIIVESDGRAELTPNSMQVKYNQFQPDLMVWDYAQMMGDNNGSIDMTTKMMNLANEAKAFAKTNDIPVVLISSATPDGKVDDIPPTVEQVAHSKLLAYMADLAVAVHKRTDSDLIDIVCRKNRNGPLFAGTLNWDINSGVMTEVSGV